MSLAPQPEKTARLSEKTQTGNPFAVKESLLKSWQGSAARRDVVYGSSEMLRRFESPTPSKRNLRIEGSGFDVASLVLNPRALPLGIPAFVVLVVALFSWFGSGNLLSAVRVSSYLDLPRSGEADQLLINYASSLNEDDIIADVDPIDTKKFEVLNLRDYVVQPGDTLSGIAARFNLNIDSIISFNDINDPRRLRVGTNYKIPNRDGLRYKTLKGDSLEGIAKKFNTSVTALLDGNDLSDEVLQTGSYLFIPDAKLNPTDLKLLLGELFLWPTSGRFTSSFGYRPDPFTNQNRLHNGIDIAAYIGAPVRAAMAGKVVAVESQIGNYGKVIIIQHPRGFKTLYGHLDPFNVGVGQYVSQGQLIGKMGNTGRSTGPHTHFSVILNGVFVNPLRYLK